MAHPRGGAGHADCFEFVEVRCTDRCPHFLRHNGVLQRALNTEIVSAPTLCNEWTSDAGCNTVSCPFFHAPASYARRYELPISASREGSCTSADVLYDTENCPVPAHMFAAAALAALEAYVSLLIRRRVKFDRVAAFHSRHLARKDQSSMSLVGVEMVDAGLKVGCVDNALKARLNDIVVDRLLRQKDSGVDSREPVSADKQQSPLLVLISGDRDFSDDIRRAQRAGFQLVLVYNGAARADFITLADYAISWEAVVPPARASGLAQTPGGAVAVPRTKTLRSRRPKSTQQPTSTAALPAGESVMAPLAARTTISPDKVVEGAVTRARKPPVPGGSLHRMTAECAPADPGITTAACGSGGWRLSPVPLRTHLTLLALPAATSGSTQTWTHT